MFIASGSPLGYPYVWGGANQYTRRANETGSVYAADVEDLRTRLDDLWNGMDKLLRGFANIS